MGYMGMGMQKWIYTMRPRKPFSMERKPLFNKVPIYRSDFKLQPSKSNDDIYISIFILLVFILIISSALSNLSSYEEQNRREIIKYKNKKDEIAFRFLMRSGKGRLASKNFLGAYSEFKLANTIYPTDLESKELLAEALTILCIDKGIKCKELDELE